MSLSQRPPQARSEALRETPKASGDTLLLQHCARCQHIQHPARELCSRCLHDALRWQSVPDNTGTLIASADLQHSLHPFFQQRLPWRIASVKLHCGPVAIVHLADASDELLNEVAVFSIEDSDEAPMLIAVAAGVNAAARARHAARQLGLLQETHNA